MLYSCLYNSLRNGVDLVADFRRQFREPIRDQSSAKRLALNTASNVHVIPRLGPQDHPSLRDDHRRVVYGVPKIYISLGLSTSQPPPR